MINNMTTQMHLAAQYLAAAGISFVEKKADDSHTNLGFSIESGAMFSRPLNEAGNTLSLNYNNFTLAWNTPNLIESYRLDGSRHTEVLNWIKQQTQDAKISKPYSYAFHYELPYQITDDFTFKLHNVNRLKELMHYRILAQLVLESFLEKHGLISEIRIWSHHFDTGAFIEFKDSDKLSIGLGLAIPDSLVNDYYFYISGYHGHDALETTKLTPLTTGAWHNNGFKGAILPATGTDRNAALLFLEEALMAYKR
ncbi:hypothetical protein [Spongiimicrobium sp. 3-5]|uniref:hypothetical protein n=1 Tax=Spongiimicrobium sp. 3-5 TaxID=3332596 RepID=UPI00397EA62E